MKTWGRKLETIQGVFERSVSDLAEKYRREVLKPLCKKHGLQFFSGMGTYFFEQGGASIGSVPHGEWEEEAYEKYGLKAVFEVLDLEVSHNQVFGYYVSDVRLGKETARGKLHRAPKDPHQ